jgi:hypothetical protein
MSQGKDYIGIEMRLPFLLRLSPDLIILLPSYLHNIEDFMNLSSSCQKIRRTLSDTNPNHILRLAAASSRVFFRPDPLFLIAATIRQVSDWALKTPQNADILRQSFKGGVETLLQLCVEKARLTMEDIRHLHRLRFSLINPATAFIDQCVCTPYECGGSEADTVDCDPSRALFQIIIYGELFASTMRAHLEPEVNLPSFDLGMRLDYLRYTVPDYQCASGSPGLPGPDRIGIFAPGVNLMIQDCYALKYLLLNNRKWRWAWEGIRREIGEDFDVEWKQNMWQSALQCQGFDSIRIMMPGGLENFRERLVDTRAKIEKLQICPKMHSFGRQQRLAPEYPHMLDEVFVCIAGSWEGLA